MKTLAVKICTKCLSNDIKRFPHTSEVYVDWNDCVHRSRVCEDFHRRYSHLSDIAVKRIVKKCRHASEHRSQRDIWEVKEMPF